MVWRSCRTALVFSVAALYGPSGGHGAEPQKWFGPCYRYHMKDGSFLTPIDFYSSFDPDAPWGAALHQVAVFKIYAAFLKREPVETVTHMFSWLAKNHVLLAVEFGPLTPEGCGLGVEGYDGPASARAISKKAKMAGGKIDFIAMDEPLWHALDSPKPNACHWPISRTAENASRSARVFKDEFPSVQIGDIEPVANLGGAHLDAQVAEWSDAFRQASGQPLAFFHFDILWPRDWNEAAAAVGKVLRQRGIPMGIVVSGEATETSDESWMASLRERVHRYAESNLPEPAQIVFQSWSPLPTHILPSNNPDSLSSALVAPLPWH